MIFMPPSNASHRFVNYLPYSFSHSCVSFAYGSDDRFGLQMLRLLCRETYCPRSGRSSPERCFILVRCMSAFHRRRGAAQGDAWARRLPVGIPKVKVSYAKRVRVRRILLGLVITIQQQFDSLVRLLSNHLTRTLVFPDSEKDWLTEAIIPGPFREFHLADHFRFDPMATSHFGGG